LATPNYGYEKRQKELAKKRKKEDKLKAKTEKKTDFATEDATDSTQIEGAVSLNSTETDQIDPK
jgi:hypothetical protein